MSNNLWIFPVMIALAVLIRLWIGGLNHNRIRGYIVNQGGEVLAIKWKPFGAGWFGEKDSAIYEVRYRDREGNVRNAVCKTSMFSGVYFTNDSIVTRARRTVTREESPRYRVPVPATSPESISVSSLNAMDTSALTFENRRLREENQQLREELERLRKETWK